MAVNDLNGVNKKDPIEQNWRKLEPIWTQTKIRTYLKKLDENYDQKGISTYFLNVGHVGQISLSILTNPSSMTHNSSHILVYPHKFVFNLVFLYKTLSK